MAIESLYILLTILPWVIIAFIVRSHFSKGRRLMRKLPGPTRLPVLGNLLEVNVPNEELTLKLMKEWPDAHGSRYGIQLGPRNYFISSQASDVEKILSSSIHIEKGDEYKFIAAWLGQGLLTGTGSKWFHHRKLITPSFHFNILLEFLEVFNAQSKIFVDIIEKDSDGGKQVLEICQYVTRCTLDIICETAMGEAINAQKRKDSPYIRAVYGICDLMYHRSVRPWLHPDLLWNLSPSGRLQKKYLKNLHGFTENVIRKRKSKMAWAKDDACSSKRKSDSSSDMFFGNKKSVAFMDLLLQYQAENPSLLSDAEIREETDTFMFEGHDTTAASLSWTLQLLGAYPECQEKVIEELDSIFGDDKDRPVCSNDLSQMKYLECCMKESLRLYPSVPYIDRHLKKDLALEDGTVIPAGFNFAVIIARLHREPEVFPQPDEFQPERFFPENLRGRHPYAYVPFSAGPRNCIGQKFALIEEKVILAHFFRNFRIESLDKREDIVLTTELILRPRDGLRVKCIKRKR